MSGTKTPRLDLSDLRQRGVDLGMALENAETVSLDLPDLEPPPGEPGAEETKPVEEGPADGADSGPSAEQAPATPAAAAPAPKAKPVDTGLDALREQAGMPGTRASTEGTRLRLEDLEREQGKWGDQWPWERRGPNPQVQAGLAMTKAGMPTTSYANCCKVLRQDPRWKSMRLNLLGELIELNGEAMDETVLLGRTAEWLQDNYGLSVSPTILERALATVSKDRGYLPPQEYLAKLIWDGEPRIDRVLPEVLGIDDGDHQEMFQKFVRRFLISAVARAMAPGCKVDTALILFGKQGAKKSGFFEVLAGEWFADSPIPIGDKDAFILLRAAWIFEAAELDSLTKRSAESIKQFLRGKNDTFRGVFERSARGRARHTVMCGTTNKSEFLNDDTGNRSFWVLPIADDWIVPLDVLQGWRDQLWAEAKAAYDAGESWWFERGEDGLNEDYLSRYIEADPWETAIRDWTISRNSVDMAEVLEGALRLKTHEMDKRHQQRVGGILRQLGFARKLIWDAGAKKPVRLWARETGL